MGLLLPIVGVVSSHNLSIPTPTVVVSTLKIWATKNLLSRLAKRRGVCADLVDSMSQCRMVNLVNARRGIDADMLNSSAPIGCTHQINRVFVVVVSICTPKDDFVEIHASAKCGLTSKLTDRHQLINENQKTP